MAPDPINKTAHEYFIAMLSDVPRLQAYWDFGKGELHVATLHEHIGAMSTGEQHIARFLAGVWLGSNEEFGFDLITAVKSLDEPHLSIIRDWLTEPQFP